METFDVIVIGQGYAGLTAARLASERGLRTANFEAQLFGGLIINLNELDPVPEGAEHSGAELASNLAMSNMDKGVETISESVTGIARAAHGTWIVTTDSGSHAARHVVIASGARLRKLGIPGEAEYFGQGVSECADCDGPMFDGMETVVVGGGDSAFQEALALSQYASKVTVIMRGDGPRARAALVEQAAANPRLVQLTKTQLVAIDGIAGKGVESVRIRTQGKAEETLPASGVFIFVGLVPNSEFLPADLPRDAAGAVVTNADCAAAVPGLWAIGAVRSGYGGLLSDAHLDAQRAIAAMA